MSHLFSLAVELMLYGLIGVFTTLILFIVMIHALTRIFPVKEETGQPPLE